MPRDLVGYPETVVDEVGQSLEAAADYIEAHGFCGNEALSADGRVCFVGAYYRMYSSTMVASNEWWKVKDRLNRVAPGVNAVSWAIQNPRDKDGAVALLRAAAKLK